MRPRHIPLAVTAAALLAQSVGLAGPALAATPVDVPFASTGAEQSWVVPAGVSTIHVVLIAGPGGSTPFGGPQGGRGAQLSGDLAVNAGDTLFVEVGGVGTAGATGAFNGGGAGGAGASPNPGQGGGGASDIRTVSRLAASGSLASRLVVAGGGGGAGGGDGLEGGGGGDAGVSGAPAFTNPGGTGGGAGTDIAGGAGGAPAGFDGTSGSGGAGASLGAGSGGGGGGGGYFGGGGAGGGITTAQGGGGGGGGSNYLGALTNHNLTLINSGVPSVTISYTPGPGTTPAPTNGPDSGKVNVQFSVTSSGACVELSTSSIDFGSVALGQSNVAAAPDITITNCGSLSEDVLAHGSNATATGATWALAGTSETCADTLGTDRYRLELESASGTVGLATANKALETLAAGDTGTHTARLFTACPGSTGAGQLMTTQITFIATTGG